MLDALPVHVAVPGPHGDEVRRVVEGLGWQTVSGDDPLVAARLRLVAPTPSAAVDAIDARRSPNDDLPRILLVPDGTDAADAARAALDPRVAAVARWPSDRHRLPALASTALDRRGTAPRPAGVPQLRIASAGGGVGATTVALALAGLHAWQGQRALVLGRGDVPVPRVPRVAASDLTSPLLWGRAAAAPGLDRLRVVRCDGATRRARVDAGDATVLVREVGVTDDADVLVARRDVAGVERVEATTAGIVVVVDVGAASRGRMTAAAAGRRLVVVDWSARVARAGLRRRVPTSLPGRWVGALRPLIGRPQPARPDGRPRGVDA